MANASLRGAVKRLKNSKSVSKGRAYAFARRLASFKGFPLPQSIDDRILENVVDIVAEAVLNTPYGRSLQFDCPLIITMATSKYCPFSCSNCYSASGQDAGHSFESVSYRIYERIAATRTPFVVITGGEPLAASSTRLGVEMLLNAGKFVYVSTNATVGGYLDLAQRYAGVFFFVLPIWGARSAHDERRGSGSFARIEKNLTMLNGVGVRANLLVVLADNDTSVFDDVRGLVERYDVEMVRVSRKLRVGREDNSSVDITAEFYSRLVDGLTTVERLGPKVIVDIPELRQQRQGLLIFSLLGIKLDKGCSAGSWMMHIDERGVGFPCFSLETSAQLGVPAELSFQEQWLSVQAARARLGDGAVCLGEAGKVAGGLGNE